MAPSASLTVNGNAKWWWPLLLWLLVGSACSTPPAERVPHIAERTVPGITVKVFPACQDVVSAAPEVDIAPDPVLPLSLVLDWTASPREAPFRTRSLLVVKPAEDPRFSIVRVQTDLYLATWDAAPYTLGVGLGADLSGDLRATPNLPEELLDRIEERLQAGD